MNRDIVSKSICWIFLFVAGWSAISFGKWEKKINLKWDASTYYLYLPAIFIYRDLYQLEFYPLIDSIYRPSNNQKKYAITPYPLSGRKVLKYPLGVAVFEAPAFALATLWCSLDPRYPADGWSEPFQLAIAFSSILFVFLGLWVLRRLLLAYFSDTVVAVSLLVIAFGTNLFFYAVIEPGLSHPYLFFLFCALLLYSSRWYRKPSFKASAVLGLAVGMAVITRPTDALIALFPVLWITSGGQSFRARVMLWQREWMKIAIAILFFCIPLLIQMTYWRSVTGYWLYYSYEQEGFHFAEWHIMDGLFSYRKGWFIYTPLALLGFIGLFFIYKQKRLRFYLTPFLIYFLATFWFVFSWWMWWYGGSFGSRVMIQSLAVLAIPLAALIEWVIGSRFVLKILFATILILGIALNHFQSWQYYKAIIHWDSMNKAYYWKVFGKTKITKEEVKLLDP